MPRSTFYQRRRSAASPRAAAKRGPRTRHTDQELTGEIAQSIAGSPFHGEGHRKVWARLRLAGVRTSKRRVLRLMREHGLLAPERQPQPAEPKRHDGTILTERPNQMWGIDATAGFTAQDGHVVIFAMVDHYSAYCLGIHAARRGTRFEALEPVRQAVKEQFGGFSEAVAAGVRLRHDHGSQFMSADFQAELRFLGINSSPAFLREPEGNGCIERFFRTLKEQLLWVRHFETTEELTEALLEFRQRYNSQWLIERLQFQSPQQAHQALLALEPAA
jgi:transposase InsO family protein